MRVQVPQDVFKGEMKMGFIYVIRNNVNNRVYVGQTINTIEERFKQHLYLFYKGRVHNKLYNAMREIGAENFYYEKVLECDNTDLNRYEQFYVTEFDSINDGYNSVFPCSSLISDKKYEYEDMVIHMYMDGYSFASIAKAINSSTRHVNDIILKNNLNRENTNYGRNDSNRQIIMYSKEFIPLKKFDSINQAFKWLAENTEYNVTRFGAYAFIDVACTNGNIAYGHRWQDLADLVYDGKLFRTKFDKDCYINGNKAILVPNTHMYITNNGLDDIKTLHNKSQNKCIDCGKILKDNRNKRCLECENKRRASNIPSKDVLSKLISEHSYEEIGRRYNVTGKTVKKWCDKYDLSKQKRCSEVEYKNYYDRKTDIEYNFNGCKCLYNGNWYEFNTCKEAAQWLLTEFGYDIKEKTARYKIGQACKEGSEYKGIKWFSR